MKFEVKSRACRCDFSAQELELLHRIASAALVGGGRISLTADDDAKAADLVLEIGRAGRAQRQKMDDARRAAADRRVGASSPNQRQIVVDGHTVFASRGDYVDAGTVDIVSWRNATVLAASGKLPVQAEMRRDVWCVTVMTKHEDRRDGEPLVVGSDVTHSNNPGEIEPLARRLLKRSI